MYRRLLGVLAAGLLGLIFIFGRSFYLRAAQVRTYANMQAICHTLKAIGDKRRLNESDFIAAINSVNNGLDEWGSRFMFSIGETFDDATLNRGCAWQKGKLERALQFNY